MKKLKNYFKTTCVLMILFSLATSHAQTVTVPANCRVVNVGTGVGGVLGLGGKVTNGGIVAMPDPSGSGTFTFTPPVVTPVVTTAIWNLKGDLSNNLTLPNNYGAATQPAAGLSATIISYNKTYRSSEGVAPSSPSWARSKGQVKISWTGAGCGSSITFDIYKSFTASPITNVPIIVGERCLKPNTQYTYSVDQIVSDNTDDAIGFDSYYWSGLPPAIATASTTYTSADRSSITFTTGGTVTPFTINCCYGRVNPNTADGGPFTAINQSVTPIRTTCVTTGLLKISPIEPGYTIAPPVCASTGTVAAPATFQIVYPNPPAGLIYTWTAINTGWLINTSMSTTTTTTVNTLGNNNPGELTLTITGACDPAIFKYQINRNLTAPLTIVPTGATTTCIAGTSTGNTYTISPTNSNSVTWYTTAVGSTTPVAIPGVTLINANSATVTVNTSSAAVGSFLLNVKSSTTACSSPLTTTINIKPATPSFTPSTPACVFKSATTPVSSIAVTPAGGDGTYSWTYPANVTCTANCTTSNPTFTLNSAGTTATLTATAIGANGCNNPVSKIINYIAVITNFPGGGFPDQYLVSGSCGIVSSWDITTASGTTNYTVTSGNISISNSAGGTNNVLSISGSSGLPITMVCANLPGSVQVCTTITGSLTQKQADNSSDGTTKVLIKDVIISPNPNSGDFTIKLGDYKESASAILTDFSGNEIHTYQLRKGSNEIVNKSLVKGTYFVVLKIDGKQEARQIIIK